MTTYQWILTSLLFILIAFGLIYSTFFTDGGNDDRGEMDRFRDSFE